ncbi:MAG: NADH/ubiquinone/plastoquinone (complex i) [Bacteroidetes bacterium]|nr:MAG: NADH/ubiquinone/plastoquinone (complex i) [Bacteroidota bacterium]
MTPETIGLIALSPLLAFLFIALLSAYQSGSRPLLLNRLALSAGAGSILVSGILITQLILQGVQTIQVLHIADYAWFIRLDQLSITMLSMVSVIGFFVIKYSLKYMDGDERQGAFTGRLAATIASVQLVIIAGSLSMLLLGWFITSVALNRLLLFYPNRSGAIIAARKKFLMARFSELFLVIAVVAVYQEFKSDSLEVLFAQLQMQSGPLSFRLQLASWSIVLAAVFKSAQFPLHGWLIEVMETPTPVSALLHAGLLNAGPYLVIRLSYLIQLNPDVQTLLIAVGGFTALYGSVVYMSQNSIKTFLSYSSAGHMGFSLFMCGLGLYPAGLLHLMAHSIYKAHAFLSSGSIIEQQRANKVRPSLRQGNTGIIILALLSSISLFFGFAYLFQTDLKGDTAMLLLGIVIILGISYILVNAWDSDSSKTFKARAFAFALTVLLAFFSLEAVLHHLIEAQIPEVSLATTPLIAAFAVVLVYTLVILGQLMPIEWSAGLKQAVYVHFKNGLYVNTVFDRLIGTWKLGQKKN